MSVALAAAAAVPLVSALAVATNAGAATISVNTDSDQYADHAVPGEARKCSLREAVEAANADAPFGGCVRQGTGSADTIVLRGGTRYDRSRFGYDDTNARGDLDITGPTAIEVNGEGRASINANGLDRVIDLPAGARLTASRLVLEFGSAPTNSDDDTGGGGIAVAEGARLELSSSSVEGNVVSGDGGCTCGGGIEVNGRTDLRRVRISANTSTNVGGGIAQVGAGSLTVSQSTIDGNQTSEGGGGIFAGGDGARTAIADSTIAYNIAGGTAPGDTGPGGGVAVSGHGMVVRLVNSTISENHAYGDGGGLVAFSGLVRLNAVTVTGNEADVNLDGAGNGGGISGLSPSLLNSIVADNLDHGVDGSGSRPDCSFAIGADGHNLVGRGGGCSQAGSNLATEDPRLGPLADNGGPTLTARLLAASPAISQAERSTAPPLDQRGVPRDNHPDVGAFERSAP